MRRRTAILATAVVAVAGLAALLVDSGGEGDSVFGTDPTSTSTAQTARTTSTTEPLPRVAPEIASLADRTAMTDEARRIFYAAEPRLVDKRGLAAACPLREEASVLGCFASGRIAILSVGDPRLDGMQETTAAHEMLHAVWARLPAAERARLTELLRAEYAGLDDQRVREKVETYRRQDPSVVDDELHSILGTEVPQLSPEVEAYYARWFTDRSVVVGLAASAQATFENFEAQMRVLDAELARLRAEIDAEEARLAAERAAIEARSAELEQLRTEERIDEYNAAVPEFNTRVDTYNGAVAAQRARVEHHNDVVELRNALVSEFAVLAETIDTSLRTV